MKTIILIAALARPSGCSGRYEIVAATQTDGTAWVLDTWTGKACLHISGVHEGKWGMMNKCSHEEPR